MPREANRWSESRPIALAVRTSTWLLPMALTFIVARLVASNLASPTDRIRLVGWWIIVGAISLGTYQVVEAATRRLLPLATLYRLSLVFPDRAPSRFKIARAAVNTRNVREQLQRLAKRDERIDPQTAAEAILALVSALSLHDRKTRGHSERTRVFTDLLAEELDLSRDAKDRLRWAALLHDIGKLSVAAEILNKDGRPDEDEWRRLQQHPVMGARLIGPLADWLGEWGDAVEQHHERFDGSGYPHGLRGHEISLAGRIVSVADAFETMTARRAYKAPMPVESARAELVRCAGSHFDPVVVRAMVNVSLGGARRTAGLVPAFAQLPIGRVLDGAVAQAAAAGHALTGGLTVALATMTALPMVATPVVESRIGAISRPPASSAAVDATSGAVAGGPPPDGDPTHAPRPAPDDAADAWPGPGGTGDGWTHESDDQGEDDQGEDDQGHDEDKSDRNGSPLGSLPDPPSLPALPSLPPPTSPSPSPSLTPPSLPPPSAPVALSDIGKLSLAAPLLIDVVANDYDPDGDLDPSTLTVTRLPLAGTVTVTSAAQLLYVPLGGSLSSDSLVYRICDAGGRCDTAWVWIKVAGGSTAES